MVPLSVAGEVAAGLLEAMREHCERVAVAGSLRRRPPPPAGLVACPRCGRSRTLPRVAAGHWADQGGCCDLCAMSAEERAHVLRSIRRNETATLKDVELVCIPRWTVETDAGATGLFGPEERPVSALHRWALSSDVTWIKPGTSEVIEWAPRPDGRYWRGLVPTAGGPVPLDLFLCTPDNWGAILAIRTGSREFSRALVTHAKQIGWAFADGQLRDPAGQAVSVPEEADVFRHLGLAYVEPHRRTGPEAIGRVP